MPLTININNQLGYLNNNVNIILDDISTFIPEKTYDIVVLDIWWEAPSMSIIESLTTKYLPFVNQGGFLYFPVNNFVVNKQ